MTTTADYFAICNVRDGERTIGPTLASLLSQTIPPKKIVVTNDGSTDRTGEIIESFRVRYPDVIEVLVTTSTTRDYSRLPTLRKNAILYARANGFGSLDYHMMAGGDCKYESDYAEKILTFMEANRLVVIASGDYKISQSSSPRGAGRFIRNSWFNNYYPTGYIEKRGSESEVKLRAQITGYKTAMVKEATFEHLDQLGHYHNFKEWGGSMKALGYSRLYVYGRIARAFFSDSQVGRRGALRMLKSYIAWKSTGGYNSYHDPDFRRAVAKHQRDKIILSFLRQIRITRLAYRMGVRRTHLQKLKINLRK